MGPCRRNLLAHRGLGRSASPRLVARRSRTRLRVRHAPRASRGSHLGPARPREVLKPTLDVEPLEGQGSHRLLSLAEADGWIRVRADEGPLLAGAPVLAKLEASR